MDLASRAGELVMVGFTGTTVTPELAEQVQADSIAGLILFARNLKSAAQVRELTAGLQALRNDGLPLLISTDQENGVVARLNYVGAGTQFPGNMPLGAAASADLAYRSACATATELLALGINFNLAPVLDVNNNPKNPVIGVRSFGEDPALVSELGRAAVRGYEETGVLACGKHFPGHGDTDIDSHLALPVVGHGRERLNAVELAPFKAAIEQSIGAIMTAHVVFPAYEADPERPATVSRSVLTGLLREELGYEGIIITDCMEMKAISDGIGTVAAGVQALKAGADIVLVSHTPALQRQTVAAIREAIASGEIPAEQVEASLRRVEAARRRVAAAAQPPLSVVSSAEHKALAEKVAAAAVTVAKDDAGVLPLSRTGLGVVICRSTLLTEAEEAVAPAPLMAQLVKEVLPEAQVLVVDRAPTPAQLAAVTALAQQSQGVIVGTYAAGRFPEQGALVKAALAANPRTVVLSQRDPYDLRALDGVGTYVVAYEDREHMLGAALKVIVGEMEAKGKLPITL